MPFPFDTHALYFSDDAITTRNALHNAFTGQRLNHANLRREFFATPAKSATSSPPTSATSSNTPTNPTPAGAIPGPTT
ncbi:GIY-YIG nuclease family protein [Rhodococcus koreensis]|uniref:hypothetical protein n=1 Tax=Rhodococcus koreensis TaxID=99653 RepID=UPI0036DE4B8E